MPRSWAEHFQQLLTAITGRSSRNQGFSVRQIERTERRIGTLLPAPLRDYYLSIGRHPMNRIHNRLLSPDDLEIHRGRLVFMEENQRVLFYGVNARTQAPDPFVVVTYEWDDGDWRVECRCSRFLSAMLCCQAIFGGLPHVGVSKPIGKAEARRKTRGWLSAGCVHQMDTFVRDGQVCGMELGEGEFVQLHLGAATELGFQALQAHFGVDVREY